MERLGGAIPQPRDCEGNRERQCWMFVFAICQQFPAFLDS